MNASSYGAPLGPSIQLNAGGIAVVFFCLIGNTRLICLLAVYQAVVAFHQPLHHWKVAVDDCNVQQIFADVRFFSVPLGI